LTHSPLSTKQSLAMLESTSLVPAMLNPAPSNLQNSNETKLRRSYCKCLSKTRRLTWSCLHESPTQDLLLQRWVHQVWHYFQVPECIPTGNQVMSTVSVTYIS
jgi:hypothetical protein